MQSLWRASLRSSLRDPHRLPKPRAFTQHRQLLLSRIPPRTQLPYLHSTIRQTGQQFQIRFFRLFTIREPKTVREAGLTFIQVGIVVFTAYGLWKVAEWGIAQDTYERQQPTPREYSWGTRVKLREALGEEDAGTKGSAMPNWKNTGDKFVEVISRLEDRQGDGKGIRGQLGDEEDIFVAGVGRTGMDVSACSEPWRRGYYQALMGAGRCAERLDGWVRDRTRGILFPEKYVVGPSFPDAQITPRGLNAAPPREEDCDPAFEQPQKYYLKVVTTRGFSVGQRLRAALAYADWLRFKGLNEAAQGMHTWAVDIALEGVESPHGGPGNIIDAESGVFTPSTSTLTSNLLLAAESFGTHFALTGNMAAALPVFLSILRTQRLLPLPPPEAPIRDNTPVSPYWEAIRAVVLPPKYPSPPPSGNDLLTQNADSVCASTRTMAHIGEVLFASDLSVLASETSNLSSDSAARPLSDSAKLPRSSTPTPAQSAGLAWTRQAANLAESTLRSIEPEDGGHTPARSRSTSSSSSIVTHYQQAERKRVHELQTRCATCLTLALDNWVQMVERFERAEQAQARSQQSRSQSSASSPSVPASKQAQDIHRMMEAAYRKDARPDDVLAKAEEVARNISAADEQAQDRSEQKEQIAAMKSSTGKGWGMFWSSKLGLTPEPEEVKVDTGDIEGKGPWAREAAKIRARRWEARLLKRQLGIED